MVGTGEDRGFGVMLELEFAVGVCDLRRIGEGKRHISAVLEEKGRRARRLKSYKM
jgi:hypothetical protein